MGGSKLSEKLIKDYLKTKKLIKLFQYVYQKTTDMVQIKKCTFEHMTKSYPCKEKSVLDGCMIMRQSIKPEDVQSPFQVEAYALLFCINAEK